MTSRRKHSQIRLRPPALPGDALPISHRGLIAELTDLARSPTHAAARNAAEELAARHPEVTREYAHLVSALIDRTRELDELRRLARTDPLTGLANRAAFDDALRRELSRCSRDASDSSLVFLDLDGLKGINDSMGHDAGDEAIVAVARACRDFVRGSDHAGRLGGDEFAVLLPGADAARARQIAERLRSAIEATRVGSRPLRVSIGVASVRDLGPHPDELIRAADSDLYRDKRSRRASAACA